MRSRILALCALALGLGAAAPALAQEDQESRQFAIYLSIEPVGLPTPVLKNPFEKVKTVPGHPVKISGVAALDLAGRSVSITVTPPQKPGDPPGPEAESKCPDDEDPKLIKHGRIKPEPPTTVSVKISSSGTFETTYTPQVEGEHEVLASGGGHRGEASFEVEELETEECEDIPEEVIQEAQEISRGVCLMVEVIRRKIEDLPASPAKDEFREKLKEFEQELKRKPACGDPPDWAAGIGAINGMHKVSPHTRKVTKKVVHQFKTWLGSARQINQQRPEVQSQLEAGNVLCDQLDIIINGLKFVDFMMNFLSGPKEFFSGFAKETLPMQLISAIPPMKRTPFAQSSLESLWKIVNNLPGKEGDERRMARLKIGLDLTTLATSGLFLLFCQQFTGPVTGTMDAEFREEGYLWWTYSIKFEGTLVLRYPKSAKGNQIPLTGEFYGNGNTFKSWDQAIPVLHPELAMGAIFKSWRLEPFGSGDVGNPFQGGKVGGYELPDLNPVTVTIEKGGLITKSIFTPAFFRVPVRGDLREDTIVVELKPAAKDFDDLRAKAFHIIGSVQGSLMPHFVSYALPYKGAHFILGRAMNDGPAEFKIEKGKDVMTIDRKFKRERSADETKGTYTLSIRACNPGCDIPQPADPKKKL
jgi:hypothetical protein